MVVREELGRMTKHNIVLVTFRAGLYENYAQSPDFLKYCFLESLRNSGSSAHMLNGQLFFSGVVAQNESVQYKQKPVRQV